MGNPTGEEGGAGEQIRARPLMLVRRLNSGLEQLLRLSIEPARRGRMCFAEVGD